MNLDAYLKERKDWFEGHLFACLPTPSVRPARLADAMAHAVRSGGKRLRPIFSLACAEATGGRPEDALIPACAIELLHTYTLVHDDLPCMDNDTLRRGEPTVWAAFGEPLAVLAGDALQALAFAVLARFVPTRPEPANVQPAVARLLEELAEAAGPSGVIAGQVEDIRYDGHATREEVEYVFRHKCGDLFRCACRMGAIAAGASAPALAAVTVFAEHVGLAFQIEDDLLDAKQAKNDAKPELTCLDILSETDARAWCEEETRLGMDALRAPELSGPTEHLSALALRLVGRGV